MPKMKAETTVNIGTSGGDVWADVCTSGMGDGIVSSSDVTQWSSSTTSDRLDAIEKRLCLIDSDKDMMNKYPALKAAYEHYKLVEALVKET